MTTSEAMGWVEKARSKFVEAHRKSLQQEALGLKPLGLDVKESELMINALDVALDALRRSPDP